MFEINFSTKLVEKVFPGLANRGLPDDPTEPGRLDLSRSHHKFKSIPTSGGGSSQNSKLFPSGKGVGVCKLAPCTGGRPSPLRGDAEVKMWTELTKDKGNQSHPTLRCFSLAIRGFQHDNAREEYWVPDQVRKDKTRGKEMLRLNFT
jgi:hypothetical protein